MRFRISYRPSGFSTGTAFFLGSFLLVLLVETGVRAWCQGFAPGIVWLLLTALVAGFVIRHGFEFFDRLNRPRS